MGERVFFEERDGLGSVVGRRRRSRPACRVAEPGSCDDFPVNLIVLCVFLIALYGVLDMCRAMCRPGVLVQHTWRVGAPVPRTGRREEPARTLLAGFTLFAPCIVMVNHGELE